MKSNHRIAIVLMATLGLFAFGSSNAFAKSKSATTNAEKELSSSVKKPSKVHKHLKKSANYTLDDKLAENLDTLLNNKKTHNNNSKAGKTKADSTDLSDTNESSPVLNPGKVKLPKNNKSHNKKVSQTKNKKHSHMTNKKLHHHDHKKGHKKYDHKVKHHHHNRGHNKGHFDNNQKNVGRMNQFVQQRKRYLYPSIGGNTRDLGGYVTKDHKYRVATGRIIRSADLDGLSQKGLNKLKALNVHEIIDLRYIHGRNGVQGHPDPDEWAGQTLKGTNIKYLKAPVYTRSESHGLAKHMKDHHQHGEYYYYGDLSVSKPQAIKTYRQVFNALLNNKSGAILYHCNLGRDRTGVTSALILSALGVDRNVIYHDYLLTDHYHYHYNHARTQPYPKQAAELQNFFRTIQKKYGSIHAYLADEIGLNHSKIMKLRKMYLVPNHHVHHHHHHHHHYDDEY